MPRPRQAGKPKGKPVNKPSPATKRGRKPAVARMEAAVHRPAAQALTQAIAPAPALDPVSVEPEKPVILDNFDIHNGILDRLGFDRLLGSASEHIMDARTLVDDARREKIQRAIRYLQRALES